MTLDDDLTDYSLVLGRLDDWILVGRLSSIQNPSQLTTHRYRCRCG